MNLKHQYKELQAAYKDLGLKVPVKLSEIKVTDEQLEYLGNRNARLIITPEINKKFNLYDLVKAFDLKQEIESYIWRGLWDQYLEDLYSKPKVSFVLQNAENDYNERHLYLTSKTLDEQRKAIDKPFEALGPIEYIIYNSIIRNTEGRLLDKSTWTRYVGLENKSVDGASIVGAVHSDDGQFNLYGDYGHADPRSGVGFSVGQDFNPQSSSFSLDFSDEQAIEQLKNNGYKIFKEM